MSDTTPNPAPDLTALPGANYLAAASLAALVLFVGHLVSTVALPLAAGLGALALSALLAVAAARFVRRVAGATARSKAGDTDPSGPRRRSGPSRAD